MQGTDDESGTANARARAPVDASEDALEELSALPPFPRYDENHYRDDSHHHDSGHYGIMYAGEYEWNNLRCTREAYGDARSTGHSHRRSLAFHTTWMDVATAKKCVQVVDSYNRYDGDHVSNALDELPSPTAVVFGRESSPVVYLWTLRPHAAIDALDGIRATPEETQADAIFAPGPPDELGGVVDADSYPVYTVGKRKADLPTDAATLIRAWWD